jgi:hypothetical protein
MAMLRRLAVGLRQPWGVALAVLVTSASCSVLLKEDAGQCKTDGDCAARGFDGATCNVGSGVCEHGTGGGAGGGNNAGQTGSGGGSSGAGTGGSGGLSVAGTTSFAEAGQAGQAGMGEAGAPSGCTGDCLTPVGVRLVESAALPAYQPPGTLLGVEQFHTDVCPQDQMLVGFDLTFGSDSSGNEFLLDVQAHCTVVSLSVTEPLSVELDDGFVVPKRGTESAQVATSLVQCLDHEVVVGWSGAWSGTTDGAVHIDKFVLRCAPLAVTTTGGVVSLNVGATEDVVPFAGYDSVGTALPAQDCPAGFVARGTNIRMSSGLVSPQRLERFGLACGRPSLVHQTGAPCTSDGDCDSGNCSSGFCGPPTCSPSPGNDCQCERLDTRDYRFCSDTVSFSVATVGCTSDKMRLVKIDDGVENGWLFSTGLLHFPASNNQAGLWIGATDSVQEGQWRWVDTNKTLFWQGMNVDQGGVAVNAAYSAWKRAPSSEEPNNGNGMGAENCGMIDINGPFVPDDRWVDTQCTDLRPYACEFEDGH